MLGLTNPNWGFVMKQIIILVTEVEVVNDSSLSYWLYGTVRSSECAHIEKGKRIRIFMCQGSSPRMREDERRKEFEYYCQCVSKSTAFELEECALLPFEYVETENNRALYKELKQRQRVLEAYKR